MPFLDDVFSGTVPDCDSLDKTHPRARKNGWPFVRSGEKTTCDSILLLLLSDGSDKTRDSAIFTVQTDALFPKRDVQQAVA